MQNHAYIEKFDRIPEIKESYATHAGAWSGLTIKGHTQKVLLQYEKHFANKELPAGITPHFLRSLLALHDIGKPQALRAGDKKLQHKFTCEILQRLRPCIDLSEREFKILLELLKEDPLGEYLKGLRSTQTTARLIRRSARQAGLSASTYFRLATIYYQSDASAYTSDANSPPALNHLFAWNGQLGTCERSNDQELLRFAPLTQAKFDELVVQLKRRTIFPWLAFFGAVGAVAVLLSWSPWLPSPKRVGVQWVLLDAARGNQHLANDWREKTFRGHTLYEILKDSEGPYLRSESTKSASALYREVKPPTGTELQLTWQWQVQDFPDYSAQAEGALVEDFAARVYVIFRGKSIFTSDVIQYVWHPTHAAGTQIPHSHPKRIKILVLRNQADQSAEWVKEQRDPVKDYEMLFGVTPDKPIGAIAFMTDSDNTASTARARFKQISFEKPIQ